MHEPSQAYCRETSGFITQPVGWVAGKRDQDRLGRPSLLTKDNGLPFYLSGDDCGCKQKKGIVSLVNTFNKNGDFYN
jgi:hypothetical protein